MPVVGWLPLWCDADAYESVPCPYCINCFFRIFIAAIMDIFQSGVVEIPAGTSQHVYAYL